MSMLIKNITLYTNQLQAQKKFYTNVLGFKLIDETEHCFTVKTGKSLLKFKYANKTTPYHFAFNITSYQEKEALQWLKRRVTLIPDEHKTLLHHFDDWNATAMYFYDPDSNIVEFIARRNLDEKNSNDFNIDAVIELSEIGVPTDNIKKHYLWLKENIDTDIYSGSKERFCAIGDERGLLICIDKRIKKWFPNNDKAYASPFKIAISNKQQNYTLVYKNDEMIVLDE